MVYASRIPEGVTTTPSRWEEEGSRQVGWFIILGEHFPKNPSYDYYVYRDEPDPWNGARYKYRPCCLYWNGGRWMAWVEGLFKGEPTEFKDVDNPPLKWAEGLFLMIRGPR